FTSLVIEPAIREADHPAALPDGPCEVAFQNVSFAYSDAAPTLSGVDLLVRPGETVALVGPSGGGKSTILSLLPRFYDVTGGSVRVNDVDVRDLSLKALRDRIALVTQEPFLFDETIAFNVAYSRPDASQEEIEAAAKAAAANEFIMARPQG